MKFTKKLVALLLGVLIAAGFVPAFGSAGTVEKGKMSAAEKAAKIEELLSFSDRLHEMTEQYAVGYTKEAAENDPYAAARIIVKSAGKVDYANSLAHVNGHNDLHIIQYANPEEARKAVKTFRETKGIEYAEPDAIMRIDQQPHENSFMSWGFGMEHINAFNYTEDLLEICGDDIANLPEIIVGVIDTGIDYEHPYFKDRIAEGGYDFANCDEKPQDDQGHGSHVSGTICDGTLPNVKIMPIKVLNNAGAGYMSDVAFGMEYAYFNGCSVANLSLGGPADGDTTMSNVINAGSDSEAKTVYCVAAGNESENAQYHCPANVTRAFTVAAHDSSKAMAGFSNYGDIVDITAPGVNINSVCLGGGTTTMDGTSMAAPHAAAACALVRSFNLDMSADAVMEILKDNAAPASFTGGGAGLLCVTDILKFDSFLNGEGTYLHYTSEGEYPWQADESGAWSGNAGIDNSASVLSTVSALKAYSEISFEYNVSSEENHDFLKFSIDGEEMFKRSGETGWQTFTYAFPASGVKNLTWEFTKDSAGDDGNDKAMIRNVVVTETVSSVLNTGKAHFLFDGDWTVDGDSAKSGNSGIDNSVSSITSETVLAAEGITFMFKYKVSCGAGDKFQFLVNDKVVLNVKSETDWTEYRYIVKTEGEYTFTFKYVKDDSGAAGSDCARVKQVDFDFTLDTVLNIGNGHLMFNSEKPFPWIVCEDYAQSGNGGMGNIESVLTLDLYLNKGDTLTFSYKVSSEPQYDRFRFFVNDCKKLSKTGDIPWTEYTFTADAAGDYSFKWVYEKDSSGDTGEDRVCLDDVYVTYAVPPPPAYIPGDCDENGEVNTADAVIALRYAIGIMTEIPCFEAGDMDSDGCITTADAITILRMAIGISD